MPRFAPLAILLCCAQAPCPEGGCNSVSVIATPVPAATTGRKDSVPATGSGTRPVEGRATEVARPQPLRTRLEFTYPTVTGRTIRVGRADNLQRALDMARRGDEVVIEAGASFRGVFMLPAKAGGVADGWIVVRSSRLSELPVGTRVRPSQATLMPRLVSPDAQPVLETALGASGWWIAGLELTVDPRFTEEQNGLVRLGNGSSAQSTHASIASDLVLDRVFLHGATTTNTKRCVALNSARTVIRDSYLDDCHGRDFDSQAIAGWNGPGPYLILNNYLAGAGENVMFGGADPAVADLTPSDIEFRGNFVVTPPAWRGVWLKKNLFELKHAARVLVEGNVFDGSWSDGQAGFAFVLKSTNQGGGCPWCATTDVVIRDNLVRNVGAVFNLAGQPESYPVAAPMSRVLIENNLAEGVNIAPYDGDGRLVQVLAGVRDLTVRRNTLVGAELNSFLTLDGNAAHNVDFSENLMSPGQYGLKAGGRAAGAPSLQAVTGIVRFQGNALISPSTSGYPATTQFVASVRAGEATGRAGADRAAVLRAVARVVEP